MMHSIRTKFILGFFVIFLVFFLILNQWVANNIESSNKHIITENLIDLKNNSNSYIRQSFLTHHFESDEIYFGQIAEEMGKTLQHATSSSVSMYSLAGEMLFSTEQDIFSAPSEELNQALDGKTAYTISIVNGEASVLYAYPVVINGTKVGIIRFAKDFTPLYEQSSYMQRTIFLIALAVFTAAFLFSYILSRHITIPLVKLTQASTEVMEGNLYVNIAFKRKDEIGRLAANFSSMIKKLREQFSIMKQDRDRLEELNHHRKRFFDNVTHELKTPLTTIMGYVDVIRINGARDPIMFEKGINHIGDESKRLHEMVLKLLEMSKATGEYHPFTTVDTSQILQDVCESMAIRAQRYKRMIRCEADAELYVHGQADRLRQLFINLLDNAIKYSNVHSEIIAIARLESGYVRIIISNQGETISPEHLERIYEPYYRTGNDSEELGSSGLGLTISKGIVDEHQGKIWMTSDDGQTSVYIDLLLTKAERE